MRREKDQPVMTWADLSRAYDYGSNDRRISRAQFQKIVENAARKRTEEIAAYLQRQSSTGVFFADEVRRRYGRKRAD
jgi:hypothetical protein